MYKAGVWQSITELNKLSLFSLHDYFWSISWRFVLADKAKRFVAMTPEERKESTCRLYAKVFQSDEALHVGILQKTKKMISIRIFYIKRLFLKQKIILDIFFQKKIRKSFLGIRNSIFFILKNYFLISENI